MVNIFAVYGKDGWGCVVFSTYKPTLNFLEVSCSKNDCNNLEIPVLHFAVMTHLNLHDENSSWIEYETQDEIKVEWRKSSRATANHVRNTSTSMSSSVRTRAWKHIFGFVSFLKVSKHKQDDASHNWSNKIRKVGIFVHKEPTAAAAEKRSRTKS